ncbi:MAG: hypothetical protein E7C76_12720, partial [Pseudomonas aeruginosa]|nr:hypothetical protein [Pseudomonas aeruginosa]
TNLDDPLLAAGKSANIPVHEIATVQHRRNGVDARACLPGRLPETLGMEGHLFPACEAVLESTLLGYITQAGTPLR